MLALHFFGFVISVLGVREECHGRGAGGPWKYILALAGVLNIVGLYIDLALMGAFE